MKGWERKSEKGFQFSKWQPSRSSRHGLHKIKHSRLNRVEHRMPQELRSKTSLFTFKAGFFGPGFFTDSMCFMPLDTKTLSGYILICQDRVGR